MSVVIDGSAGVTTNIGAVYNGLQTGIAQASTSGTAISFTSVPSWVKRITMMFNGISTSGTSIRQVQLGSTTYTTTGYVSYVATNGTTLSSVTTGFPLGVGAAAADVVYGTIVVTNISGNIWIASGNTGPSYSASLSGGVTLAGTLDRIQITTVNGTDTFDLGSINIIYE
jgi:hypothetical protein